MGLVTEGTHIQFDSLPFRGGLEGGYQSTISGGVAGTEPLMIKTPWNGVYQ